jgi:hypothetical protein
MLLYLHSLTPFIHVERPCFFLSLPLASPLRYREEHAGAVRLAKNNFFKAILLTVRGPTHGTKFWPILGMALDRPELVWSVLRPS